jgi:hypothetical protein
MLQGAFTSSPKCTGETRVVTASSRLPPGLRAMPRTASSQNSRSRSDRYGKPVPDCRCDCTARAQRLQPQSAWVEASLEFYHRTLAPFASTSHSRPPGASLVTTGLGFFFFFFLFFFLCCGNTGRAGRFCQLTLQGRRHVDLVKWQNKRLGSLPSPSYPLAHRRMSPPSRCPVLTPARSLPPAAQPRPALACSSAIGAPGPGRCVSIS